MFELIISKPARRHLKRLDKRYQNAAGKALKRLQQNPHIGEPLKGPFKGLWKLRFPRYRIIYQIKNRQLIIIVISILHRREVYR